MAPHLPSSPPSAMPLDERMEVKGYGAERRAEDEGFVLSRPAASRRAWGRVVAGVTAAIMASLLVISAKDLFGVLAKKKERSALLADTGGNKSSRTQVLLDARAMHLKLSEDLSALDRIIGKGTPELTSSLKIINKADRVKDAAAKLVGKEDARHSAVLEAALMKPKTDIQPKRDVEPHEEKSAAKSAAPEDHAATLPFANDKRWSVHAEKEDMNNFFDNLDKGAAVKELAERKAHQLHAANREREERLAEKAEEQQESDNTTPFRTPPPPEQSTAHLKDSTETKQTAPAATAPAVATHSTTTLPPTHEESEGNSKAQAKPLPPAPRAAAVHEPEEARRPPNERAAEKVNKGMSAAALRADEEAFFDHEQDQDKKSLQKGELRVQAERQQQDMRRYFQRREAAADLVHKEAEAKRQKQAQARAAPALKPSAMQTEAAKDVRASARQRIEHKMSTEEAQQDFERYFDEQTSLAESKEEQTHLKVTALRHSAQKPPGASASAQDPPVVAHKLAVKEEEHAVPALQKAMASKEAAEEKEKEKEGRQKDDKEAAEDKEHAVQTEARKEAREAKMRKEEEDAAKRKEEEEVEGVRKAMTVTDAMTDSDGRADLNSYYSDLVEKARIRKEQDMKRSRALK